MCVGGGGIGDRDGMARKGKGTVRVTRAQVGVSRGVWKNRVGQMMKALGITLGYWGVTEGY